MKPAIDDVAMREPAPLPPVEKSTALAAPAVAPGRALPRLMAEGAAVLLRASAIVLLLAPVVVLAALALR